jgi:hypothetical protein
LRLTGSYLAGRRYVLGRYLAGTRFLAMKRTHPLLNRAWRRRRIIELRRRFGRTLTVACVETRRDPGRRRLRAGQRRQLGRQRRSPRSEALLP